MNLKRQEVLKNFVSFYNNMIYKKKSIHFNIRILDCVFQFFYFYFIYIHTYFESAHKKKWAKVLAHNIPFNNDLNV